MKQSFPLVFSCIFGNSLFYKDFPSVLVVVFCVVKVYIYVFVLVVALVA